MGIIILVLSLLAHGKQHSETCPGCFFRIDQLCFHMIMIEIDRFDRFFPRGNGNQMAFAGFLMKIPSPDMDLEYLMCTEEGLSDEEECTWLCSGGTATSYLSPEELQSLDSLEMDYLFDSENLLRETVESPQRVHGIFRRSDTSTSLLDLEEEEADWDREGIDALGPDFPSPSYRIRGRIKTRSPSLLGGGSPASPASVFQLSPAAAGGDEPLFWPFNRRSYSEFQENYLGISPRASMLRIKRRSSSKSVQIRVRRSSEDIPERRIGGRITISARSGRSAPADRRALKATLSGSQVSRTGQGPSRLSRSAAAAPPTTSGGASKNAAVRRRSRHQLNSVRKKPRVNMKASLVQWLLEFEAAYFQIFLAGGMSIESLVGLKEFDGL